MPRKKIGETEISEPKQTQLSLVPQEEKKPLYEDCDVLEIMDQNFEGVSWMDRLNDDPESKDFFENHIKSVRKQIKLLELELGEEAFDEGIDHLRTHLTITGGEEEEDEEVDIFEVPEHSVPIRADVTNFRWELLGKACQFDVITMDPPWQLASGQPTRGVSLIIILMLMFFRLPLPTISYRTTQSLISPLLPCKIEDSSSSGSLMRNT